MSYSTIPKIVYKYTCVLRNFRVQYRKLSGRRSGARNQQGNEMKKVFIDGSAGTTGLRIRQRLSGRADLTLCSLPEALRKDPAARADALNGSDLAFLCLPDAAAVEAVSMVTNKNTILLDTSTAHRTDPGWAYGFPELSPEHASRVRESRRIAVPGCHASGFIALVYPLIAADYLAPEAQLTCLSLTGYSGGGKQMIAAYEAPNRPAVYSAPRQYALGQQHKHLPEMQSVTGLETAPVFCPVVADFHSGMEVTVPVFRSQLRRPAGPAQLNEFYRQWYQGGLVRCAAAPDADGFLSANVLAGKDTMELFVAGNDERLLLTARYDNLGKGASGAAIECMNLVLGLDLAAGLEL